jgi:hypothetical protein
VLERDREAHKFTMVNAHKDMRYLADLGMLSEHINAIEGRGGRCFSAAATLRMIPRAGCC